jgi:hypothetical protein
MSCTARGGSYLVSQILSTHPRVTVASEPFLELFRSFRNAIFYRDKELTSFYSKDNLESLPFQDYFFYEKIGNILKCLHDVDANISCSETEWNRVYKIQIDRLELQCKELIESFHKAKGNTYKEIFNNALYLIQKARSLPPQDWVGIKDAWVIETFIPLAKSFTDAKFIIVLRDPRASVASNLNVRNKDMIAHSISFARSWRKNVAFSVHLRSLPEFKNRIHFVSYEKLVTSPKEEVTKLSNFLEIEYDKDMIDTDKFIDYSTGNIWKGNSSYESETKGISPNRIDRWKEYLTDEVIAAVEYICGHDLALVGLKPTRKFNPSKLNSDAFNFFVEDNIGYKAWRTDSGIPELEYGYESTRNTMLLNKTHNYSDSLREKAFLFTEVYEELISDNPRSLFD